MEVGEGSLFDPRCSLSIANLCVALKITTFTHMHPLGIAGDRHLLLPLRAAHHVHAAPTDAEERAEQVPGQQVHRVFLLPALFLTRIFSLCAALLNWCLHLIQFTSAGSGISGSPRSTPTSSSSTPPSLSTSDRVRARARSLSPGWAFVTFPSPLLLLPMSLCGVHRCLPAVSPDTQSLPKYSSPLIQTPCPR